ncbi:MAG: undecaprenyl/decaprenyl-phosphate alpha-N-acetylglucosaminyl 1-phosphate transferase [Bacteroidota bacterium]|nr:undecaprenyl/decaprenyl-phosphate alpha-N-acetylglucosaminyl 1-phosphate transferase [Bacteroidota bacterium]MDX5404591.1 undecaprenyl/decaprenyl-phosphate alpha-N-acetylglucosaminyl 1-phosphate transferase [Bacteroidota bacterium]MDX5427134.1 undecaprenyl/decaprenyl-phosphate alpha-N-acetylglucosaminyl 1-phosphate transferase [Bacteroidota bacterium]MDX5447583.1 undecaprenyl/decaprenyl-phosphate alpha-N-acetylglucosaminyl 1-phosphate transferase [Bacteroidota bacterium]MDX5505101.1 undecapr
MSINDSLHAALSFFTAFVITYLSVPAIIRLSLVKRLYDEPDQRKLHSRRISALGGVGIFGGMIFSFIFFTAYLGYPTLNSIIAGLIVLFVTGVKDDLFPMVPYKKFLGQILAVLIVVIQGDIRLVSLYGILDVWELPYLASIGLTSFFFLGIINSFNFIDGINGLSAGIGIVVCSTYGYWFYRMEEPLFLILSLSITGALLSFLRFNLVNARIFMGDSGSMVLGFLSAILTIQFIQEMEVFRPVVFENIAAMVYAFAVLIIPIFDTVRVVFYRVVILKRSPFAADRNHIHHSLLKIGLTHVQASGLLVTINLLFILLTYTLNLYIRAKYQMVVILVLAFILSQIPFVIKKRMKRQGRYPVLPT